MQVKMRQQWAQRAAPGRLTVRAVPVQFGHGWAHSGAPSLGCRGLLDRAGLNGLASMTSPALKAPTPSRKPSSVRSPGLSETTGADAKSSDGGLAA